MAETSDLDFLKDLPTVPPEAPKESRLKLTLQILAVPLIFLAISVGIFVLFTFMTYETQTMGDLLTRLRNTRGQEKATYARDFTYRLARERGKFTKPAPPEIVAMVPSILDAIREIEVKSEQDSRVKRTIIQSLAVIRDAKSAPQVAEMMRTEGDEAIVADFLDVLGACRNPSTGPDIRAKLKTGSPFIRKYAAFNLAALRDPENIPALKALLKDDSVEVRWNAAFGLAYFLDDASGLDVVRGMLEPAAIPEDDERYEELRSHAIKMAAKALGKHRDTQSLPKLKEISEQDGNPTVRSVCRDAIQEIQKIQE